MSLSCSNSQANRSLTQKPNMAESSRTAHPVHHVDRQGDSRIVPPDRLLAPNHAKVFTPVAGTDPIPQLASSLSAT